ncbi:PAS domain-containing sensor histidine kinase [Pseudomonas sp. S37]|uniref:PAS domain-containing sensor histidine kinase n=1 Tax=Pseudomonas sp. S37 TaxID=2767449 RepID=UPI0019126FF4|nr:PAS domain-containing sensor histidine kinase [Pseudomonas sp. S37]MBK4992411.1 PAS domain-containing sensor histidine kinase [Pseudomonas sp. S37]
MSEDAWGPTDAAALLDQAPCGLVVTTEDGTILSANRTFATWIGSSPFDLRGRRFQELLTMGGRIFHQTHWAPLMKLQGSVAEVKLDLLHTKGHVITMLLNGARREHAEGVRNELAFFGTVERDRYERELLAARKRAEELLSEKATAERDLRNAQAALALAYEHSERRASFAEQMIAIASHDLKNPLTAIKMASELLGRVERCDREQKLLSSIVSSSERAHRMIADLLDLASVRIGQGLQIKRQLIDVCRLVDQSVGELRVAFAHAQIRHLSKGAGWAEVDPDRTQQMIGNLVANSVAYGDLRHPITITTELRSGALWVSVHNHGQVIPQSLIPDLFEPMTRASDRTDHVRSVGLGLFIVREITNAHGGTVNVCSSPDRGTAFQIQLPLR